MMRKFAIAFLSAAAICGPLAAHAAVVQNAPPVIDVSGASSLPSDQSYQIAQLGSEVMTLQQQVKGILQQAAPQPNLQISSAHFGTGFGNGIPNQLYGSYEGG
jgi:hypothetical protein